MVGQSFCPRAAMEQGTAQPTRSCRFIRMHSREWWEVGSEAGERRTCQSTGAGNRRCSCVGRTVVVLWTDEREGAAAASGKIPCRVVYTGRRISEEPCHHRRRDMWLYARAKSPEAERGKGRGQKGGLDRSVPGPYRYSAAVPAPVPTVVYCHACKHNSLRVCFAFGSIPPCGCALITDSDTHF